MSGGDFFLAEAKDCLSELDALLGSAAPPDRLRPAARRLRGSAHMASREQSLRVASALERVVRAAEGGDLDWDSGTRGALSATLSDLERIVESDSVADAEEALSRLRALGDAVAAPRDALDAAGGDPGDEFAEFARGELARIGAALEAAATAARAERPDRAALRALLDAQAALAGSARLAELPVTARGVEAADHLARALLAGARGGEAWAQALREIADVLRAPDEGATGRTADQLSRLERARGVAGGPAGREAEIPVEVVNFFRSEARAELARAEQLARDAAEGRTATAADRLRGVLDSLATTAVTFGFAGIAETLEGGVDVVAATPGPELPAAVGNLAGVVLGALGLAADDPGGRRGGAGRARAGAPAPIVTADADGGEADRADEAAGGPPSAPRPGPAADRPAEPDADGAIPIASLCYAGDAALRRASELRAAWESAGPEATRGIVEELFDLIELARA